MSTSIYHAGAVPLHLFWRYQRCQRSALLAPLNSHAPIKSKAKNRVYSAAQYHQQDLERAVSQALCAKDFCLLTAWKPQASLSEKARQTQLLLVDLIAQIKSSVNGSKKYFLWHPVFISRGFYFSPNAIALTVNEQAAIKADIVFIPHSARVKKKHRQQLAQFLYLLEADNYLSAQCEVGVSLMSFQTADNKPPGNIPSYKDLRLSKMAAISQAVNKSSASPVLNKIILDEMPDSCLYWQSLTRQSCIELLSRDDFLQQLDGFSQQWQACQILREQLQQGAARPGLQLDLQQEPKGTISKQCSKPCSLYTYCFDSEPEYSLLEAPLLTPQIKTSFQAQYGLDLTQYPDVETLTPRISVKQQDYLRQLKAKKIEIDWPAIATDLSGLEYPLGFLDFEADNPMLNPFAAAPLSKLVFQYSLHKQDEPNGTLTHCEYLHMDKTDPRYVLAEKLMADLAGLKTLLVWHAEFERKRLLELSRLKPAFKPLAVMADALIDLEVIMRQHYQDYRFRGSYALKRLSRVLLENSQYAGYQACDLSNGRDCMDIWQQLLHSKSAESRVQYQQILSQYCHQDTLTLVRLLELLQQGIADFKRHSQS